MARRVCFCEEGESGVAEAAKDLALTGSGEDREHPQRVALPQVENAEPARIGLKRFTREREDWLELARPGALCKTNHIVNQPGPVIGRDAVEIALRTARHAHMFRDFACHGDTRSG